MPILAKSLEVAFVPGAEEPVAMTMGEVELAAPMTVGVALTLATITPSVVDAGEPLFPLRLSREKPSRKGSTLERFVADAPVRVTRAFSMLQLILADEKSASSLVSSKGML